jgi:hypothetical protein
MDNRDGDFVFRPENDDATVKGSNSDISTPEPSEKDAARIEQYAGQPKTEAQQDESDEDNTIVHT